ncbi:phage integrase N-terminal SAM-like domain-containing protein [bacterium]|nr:phage integrase N-terminal SAM-like domain-containing protein [bacterium]
MITEINNPRLLDQIRQFIRIKHYNLKTEESYINWIKRFIFFHNKKSLLIFRLCRFIRGIK